MLVMLSTMPTILITIPTLLLFRLCIKYSLNSERKSKNNFFRIYFYDNNNFYILCCIIVGGVLDHNIYEIYFAEIKLKR